jgi:dolichol-phosphate mannosyltransferase
MSLSIIIPCRNEKDNIINSVEYILLNFRKIKFEIILINDFSSDNTLSKLKYLKKKYNNVIYKKNVQKGLGGAIKLGINLSNYRYVCIMMADLSESVLDLKKYYNHIKSNKFDAILGSRFIDGSRIIDYPKTKFILNRLFNYLTMILFFSKYSDFTNAFKIYKKKSLLELYPLVSENFNIFLEIPLKIISRKYKYKVIPISWSNRKLGKTKFYINELGSKYFFTLLYCWLEKILLKKKK